MSKLKTPLVAAGAGCIVSMLIGLISGVGFLNILMRGIVAGLGVGGFVFCARLILQKFIPDLFVRQSVSGSADSFEPSAGANVNITLDEGMDPFSADEGNTAGNHSALSAADSGSARAAPETSAADLSQTDTGARAFSDSPALSFTENSGSDSAVSDFPDMTDFMESDAVSDAQPDSVISSDGSGFSISGIQPADTDSKVMAQAIRTILATED